MSLRTRFLLSIGIGGIFFLFAITWLVFNRMSTVMELQLEEQFHRDAHSRVVSVNNVLNNITDRFQKISRLPMFKSMRFHQLTLNQAAFKNDVRQMELYLFESIKKSIDLTQVVYINNESREVFHVDKMGIQSNLSDRSQDRVISQMLKLDKDNFYITLNAVNDRTQSIVWWIPVYVSADKIDGVMGFSVSYSYILNLVSELGVSAYEDVCLNNAEGVVLVSSGNKNQCNSNDDKLWKESENINLPGLSWTLALTTNPEVFLDEVKEIRLFVFGVIFPLVTIIALAVLLFFSNSIIRSIRQLVDAARIMGTGKEFIPIQIKREDELGELAKEMNRSAKLIEANRNELEERNRDTVERNRRNLQAIMDNSPAVVYVKDIDGKYTFINHEFEKIFHLQSRDILGKNDFDIFSHDIANTFHTNDQAVIKAGCAIELEELVPQDDGVHSYHSIKFPLFNDANEIYALCGISSDLTGLKAQEEMLRRSQKMDALGKLTGGIAHDYNNMLGIILGYADLLKQDLEGQPRLEKFTNEILHAGQRGAKLTQKLLAFTRKNVPDAKQLNINKLLQVNQHMLEKTLTVRIKLVFDLEEDLWDVYLDSNELEDAIINISINAMHAIERDGQITFQTRNQSINERDARFLDIKSGDYVILNITDTGSGMEKNILDKIFDPFYSTKGDAGTGLGLSQVYGFVNRSGGKIKVNSDVEKGTRFSLYFPADRKTRSQVVEKKDDILKTISGHETILVVDDEQALGEMAAEILTQQGYKVLLVHNAQDALAALEVNSVDLLISDVIMPDMDGYQLATIAREKYPAIKIQLVSGFNDDRHINMTDKNLYEQLILKPYTIRQLLERVKALLVTS